MKRLLTVTVACGALAPPGRPGARAEESRPDVPRNHRAAHGV